MNRASLRRRIDKDMVRAKLGAPKSMPVEFERRVLKGQLSDITREIVRWRDMDKYCVEKAMFGSQCQGDPQWSHVIPQSQSPFLIWELGNSNLTCRGHNFLHQPKINKQNFYFDWFVHTWGSAAFHALTRASVEHVGYKYSVGELRALLEHHTELYENRFYVSTDMNALVAAGYHGEIIQAAWLAEGRIQSERNREAG